MQILAYNGSMSNCGWEASSVKEMLYGLKKLLLFSMLIIVTFLSADVRGSTPTGDKESPITRVMKSASIYSAMTLNGTIWAAESAHAAFVK